MKTGRSNLIQIMRGIAITLIVTQHALSNISSNTAYQIVEKLIDRFGVVTFFIISGYLFQKNVRKYEKMGKANFIIAKFKELMIPYFFWTLLLDLLVIIASKVHSLSFVLNQMGFQPKSIVKCVVDAVLFQDYYVKLLWFIYALFIMFVVSIVLSGIPVKGYYIAVVYTLFLIVGFWVEIPYLIYKVIFHFVNFYIGRVISEQVDIEQLQLGTVVKWSVPVLLVTILDLYVLHISSLLSKGYISWMITDLEFRLLSLSGVALIFVFSRQLIKGNLKNILTVIGNHSYAIYLMHQPYIVAILSTVLDKMGFPAYVTLLLSIGLGLLIPIIIDIYVIERNAILKALAIGKWK